MQDEFDKSSAGNRFAGAYLTEPSSRKGRSSHAALHRRDVNVVGEVVVGKLNSSTLGFAPSASCRPASTTTSRWRCNAATSTQRRHRLGRTLAAARIADRLVDAEITGEYARLGDKDPSGRQAPDRRSAVSDAPRQVRPGRPGGLEEPAPRPHRLRDHAR